MTVDDIVRRDLLVLRRSKFVPFLGAAFVCLVGGLHHVIANPSEFIDHDPFVGVVRILPSVAALVVPLLVIGLTHGVIAGERESGNVQYLLSLPVSRGVFLAGISLSRFAVVGTLVLGSMLFGSVVIVVQHPGFNVVNHLLLSLLLVGYALAFAGIGIGASAIARTRMRALGIAGSAFVLFTVVWVFFPESARPPVLVAGALEWLFGTAPEWIVDLVWLLSPTAAFLEAVSLTGESIPLSEGLSPEPALGALVIWLFVGPALGYYSFQRADLA